VGGNFLKQNPTPALSPLAMMHRKPTAVGGQMAVRARLKQPAPVMTTRTTAVPVRDAGACGGRQPRPGRLVLCSRMALLMHEAVPH
jgi:hypothetical protein